MDLKKYSRTALRKMSDEQLETILAARGLSKDGSKTARVTRILEHQDALDEGGPIEGNIKRPVLSRKKRHLSCKLTEGEWTERAARLAQVEGEITNEKEHQKDVRAQLKATMTSLESERSSLATQVRNKTEYRDVPVRVELDEERGLAIEIREDTGEQIRERPLTDEERQLELPEPPEIDFGSSGTDDDLPPEAGEPGTDGGQDDE